MMLYLVVLKTVLHGHAFGLWDACSPLLLYMQVGDFSCRLLGSFWEVLSRRTRTVLSFFWPCRLMLESLAIVVNSFGTKVCINF